jgi:hypothetical protein
MKYGDHNRELAADRPDWTYSVPAPRTYSPLWVLERLAALSVPLALVAVIAIAVGFGYISLN